VSTGSPCPSPALCRWAATLAVCLVTGGLSVAVTVIADGEGRHVDAAHRIASSPSPQRDPVPDGVQPAPKALAVPRCCTAGGERAGQHGRAGQGEQQVARGARSGCQGSAARSVQQRRIFNTSQARQACRARWWRSKLGSAPALRHGSRARSVPAVRSRKGWGRRAPRSFEAPNRTAEPPNRRSNDGVTSDRRPLP